MEVSIAFGAFHHLQHVDGLLQENRIRLIGFYLRTINFLKRFAIGYATVDEDSDYTFFNLLKRILRRRFCFCSNSSICIFCCIQIVLEELLSVSCISLNLLHRGIHKIKEYGRIGFLLIRIYRLFQPSISLIQVWLWSVSQIVNSLTAFCTFHTIIQFCTLCQELRNIFHFLIINRHQFIKIFLVVGGITVFNTLQKALQNIFCITICIESQCRTIFQDLHTGGISILKVSCLDSFVRDTAVGITVVLCVSSGCSTRKEQDRYKRLNFHCI